MPAPIKPNLVLFTTGGTIASRRDAASGAVQSVASGQELIELVPGLDELADVVIEPVASVNSWNMTPDLMWELGQRLERTLADPAVTGAIVTHGTDTVEETSFLVDLTLRSDKPVVFVTAMRNLSELGGDGPRNLLDAARVAVDPAAVGRGVLLVSNETAHAARYVTKMNTVNPATFVSPDYGPAALVTGGGVRFLHPPAPRRRLDVTRIEPEVLLVKVSAGADDRILGWALAAGYRGIVVEGSGAGNVPAAVVPGIEAALAAGVPVVFTSRCPYGFLSPTYGSGGAAGGGFDLVRLGAIAADHLPGQKARIKLMVALGATSDVEEVRRIFAETG